MTESAEYTSVAETKGCESQGGDETSSPFISVKEAVDRVGSSGLWITHHLLLLVGVHVYLNSMPIQFQNQVPSRTIDVILSYRHYNINDSTLNDMLPYLKSKGIGVISASPLAMSLLIENGPPKWHPAPPELKAACKDVAAYCKEKGKSITNLAMQYNLSNKDISTILVGMNSVKQVDENVETATKLATGGKDEKTLAEIEGILKPVKNLT